MAEELPRLQGPYEILDLPPGGSKTIRVRSYERGSMVIHPRYEGAPESKVIPVLRVHLFDEYKEYPPLYLDITSKTLIAQLLPLISMDGQDRYEYVITKHGVRPRARFTLERRRA